MHLPLVVDVNETTTFLARGMLISTLTAMGASPECREEGMKPWGLLGSPEAGINS